MTCLFVGNLIKAVNESKLQNVFKVYGKCETELKGPYAFVEYDEADDAKQALKELNRTNLKGVNGAAKSRIEFAYKRKKNDKLEDNDISLPDDEDVFSDKSEEVVKRVRKRSISKEKSNINTKQSHIEKPIRKNFDIVEDDKSTFNKRKNVCFICKLPGHFAKDCILTKDSCYECGEKGHIAKECQGGVREAKILTENRVKAIFSQQSAFKYISVGGRLKNIVNYLNDNPRCIN